MAAGGSQTEFVLRRQNNSRLTLYYSSTDVRFYSNRPYVFSLSTAVVPTKVLTLRKNRYYVTGTADKLFENNQIRVIWDDSKEEHFFCVNDIVTALTETVDATNYLKQLRHRDPELSKVWLQIVTPLSVETAGGLQKMNFSTLEGIFRIIQSIPSKKAEPIKRWLAAVGAERIDQMQDPEKSIEQAIADYRRLGYSEQWVNQRIKTIEIRKKLTDEWKRGGILDDVQYASLTDIISKTWSGLTTREYKNRKGLHKQSLRDNMTDIELMLNGLAEASATAISKEADPEGFEENALSEDNRETF